MFKRKFYTNIVSYLHYGNAHYANKGLDIK